MSSFTEPLQTEQDGDVHTTSRDLVYWTDCDDTRADEPLSLRCRVHIVVPAGFKTDGASIPRLLWPVFGHPFERYAAAAVLHDSLYRIKTMSRAEADRIFLEAMAVLGVPKWKRNLMYAGVRAGGWWYWNRSK